MIKLAVYLRYLVVFVVSLQINSQVHVGDVDILTTNLCTSTRDFDVYTLKVGDDLPPLELSPCQIATKFNHDIDLVLTDYCMQNGIIDEIEINPCVQNIYDKMFNDTENIISSIVKSGDVVFDVGANVGLKTLDYLGAADEVSVIAIEPQPSCVNKLNEMFGGENSRVTIIPKGVSKTKGFLELSICTNENRISTFSKLWKERFAHADYYQFDQRVSVEVTTLDTILSQQYKKGEKFPKFCKLDVEGFELEAIEGLSVSIPYISFEFFGAPQYMQQSRKVAAKIEELGNYRFNIALGNSNHFLLPLWVHSVTLFALMEKMVGTDVQNLWGDIYAREEV